MFRVENLSTILLAIAIVILGVSFTLQGFWPWGLVIVLAGLLWWIAEQQLGWHWASSFGLVVLALAAAAGYWFGIHVILMLAVVILALSAWDLDAFVERLAQSPPEDSPNVLARGHLRRLIIINTVALALAAFSLTIELRFNFAIAFLLGLLMAFSLNRLLVSLSKNNQ